MTQGGGRENFRETKWENNGIENLLGERSCRAVIGYVVVYTVTSKFSRLCSVRGASNAYCFVACLCRQRFLPSTSAHLNKLRAVQLLSFLLCYERLHGTAE